MPFDTIEPKVSPTMNGFLILANIINVVYNIPQMSKTYKTKHTEDFNLLFIALRIIGNLIWISYSIEVHSLLMIINTYITVYTSLFIGYYKWQEYLETKMKLTFNEQLLLNEHRKVLVIY
jgi:uncharacterized protein with PQ loop repeat